MGADGQDGKDGAQGIQGPPGENGQTSYLHIAYANSADGQTDFSVVDSNNKLYIGQYTDFVEADSADPAQYSWSKIKGEQGEKGETGESGKTSYFHIKYSAVANPTSSSQISETPNIYIGTYVDYTEADSTDPSKYTWSRFQGLQGETGEQGIPGTNGDNGLTSYLHIKYSNDGGTTFTANSGETVGDYIGQYTDFTEADSTNPSKYKWSKIKGETGEKGATGEAGVGITSVDVYYYLSTSPTELTGGSWVTTAPEWVNGSYMWSKTVTTYTKGDPTETDPVCITGAKGEDAEPVITFLPAQGENLILEQSGGNGFKKIHIYGDTQQATRSGKNLYSSILQHSANVTVNNSDLTIDFSQDIDTYARLTFNKELGKTYTFVFDGSGMADGESVTFYLENSNQIFNFKNGKNVWVQTANNDNRYFTLDDRVRTNISSTITISNIMILEGEYTEATIPEYEPYGAMPSPDFPSEIENVESKNIINQDTLSNAYISSSGEYKNDIYNKCSDYISVSKGTYSFSAYDTNNKRIAKHYQYAVYDKDKNFITRYSIEYNNPFEINDSVIKYIRIWQPVSSTDAKPQKLQLEKGTVATEYVPYNSLVIKTTGKNLFNIDGNIHESIANYSMSGTNTVANGILTTTANGSSSRGRGFKLYVQEGDIIRFSAIAVSYGTGTNAILNIVTNTKTQQVHYCSALNTQTTNMFIVPKGVSFVICTFVTNSGTGAQFKDIVITKNNANVEYESYKEQITYFPLSEGQKLYEGSYLADDGIHHNRAQLILDGTENIADYGNNLAYYIDGINPKGLTYENHQSGNGICSHLSWLSNGGDEDNSVRFQYQNGARLYLMRRDTNLTQIKAWLSEEYANGTPVIIEYETEYEIIVPYTEKQQQAYHDIKTKSTFYGLNHVNCIGTLPIYLDTEYWTWFKGESGIDIQAVKINPSTQFFKSTSGTNGIFNPEYIYLYPSFQNVDYNKWQYSTDGTTWTDVVSGSNGLTIATYNSVDNSLRIQNTSDLFTNTITSINFRCVSSANAIYDSCTITKLYDANSEIIVGTQTAATNVWTGIASFAKLVDGQQIVYWLPYAGTSSSATLELTLADGTTTGAKNLYYQGTTRMTTHYPAGSVIHLTYRENVSIAGSTTKYTGWWGDANYTGSDTYDRIKYNSAITAVTAISSGRIITGTASGFKHIAANTVFDINKPILYAGSAIAAAATGSNNYIAYSNLNLANTKSGFTGTKGKTVYIVGTLNGTTFTPNSTLFTTTEPITADGLVYIALGVMSSTTNSTLFPEHPLYKFVNGKFQSLSQVAFEAQDNLDNLEIGGRNYILESDFFTSAGSGAAGITPTIEDGVWKIVSAASNGNWLSWSKKNVIETNFQTGDVFTFSMEIKCDEGATGKPKIYFKNGMGYYAMTGTVSTEYSVLYYTGTWKDTNDITFHLGFGSAVGTFYIRRIKFERGDKPTDWTPAPEDTDDRITQVEGDLTGKYNDLVNNDIAAINNKLAQEIADTKTIKEDLGVVSQQATTLVSLVDENGKKTQALTQTVSNMLLSGESLDISFDRTKGVNLLKNSVMQQHKTAVASGVIKADFWLNKNLEEDYFSNVYYNEEALVRKATVCGNSFQIRTKATDEVKYDFILSSPIDLKENVENLLLAYKIKGNISAGNCFVGLVFYKHLTDQPNGLSFTSSSSNPYITNAYYVPINCYAAAEGTNIKKINASFTQDYIYKTMPLATPEAHVTKEVNETLVAEEGQIELTYLPQTGSNIVLVSPSGIQGVVSASNSRLVTLPAALLEETIVTVTYNRSIETFKIATSTTDAQTQTNSMPDAETTICYNSSSKKIYVYNPFTKSYYLSNNLYDNTSNSSNIDTVRVIIGICGATISSNFVGDIEIADLKLEYDSTSVYWTQNLDESYSKKYRMDEKGFSISSDQNMMFIDENQIAAYQLEETTTAGGETIKEPDLENPVFQISGDETQLQKTIIYDELKISNRTKSEEGAFVFKQLQTENGNWYFLFY